MIVQAMSGVVQSLQGVLARIDADGNTSLIKQGAVFKPSDSLVLLSGASQVNLTDGQAISLALNKPYTLNGISPLLKPDSFVWDEFVEKSLDKNVDIAKLLASFEATTAGEAVLGSGGSIFVLDPMFGSGLVTAGFQTRGPFSDGLSKLEHGVQWYANTEPEAILTLTSSELNLDESIVVRNNDFNAADSAGIVDPFNFGTLIGFSEGFLVSGANSLMNQPANMVSSSYKLELGDSLSTLRASDGTPIVLSIEDHRIVARSSGEVVFAIGIDANTGRVTVAQYHGLYHPDSNSADESINLSGLVKVTLTLTDRSGDVSTASVDIGAKINFEDDAPFIHSIQGIQLIDDPANGMPIIGEINVDFGSDLAKNVIFGDAITSLIKANLTSNGNALVYQMDTSNHELTAINAVTGTKVFTLSLSEITPNTVQLHMPQYSLTVYEAIDQPQDIDKISLDIPIKAIDADNDSVIGYINIIIDDGGDPAGGFNTGFMAVEGDLTGGLNGYPTPVTTTYSFSIPAGVDRLVPASLSIDSANLQRLIDEFQQEITAGGSPLRLSIVSNGSGVITITAQDNQSSTVFELTITPTNVGKDLNIDVTLVQFKPLDHQSSANVTGLVQQDGSNIRLDLPLQAKDSDGDPLQSPVNLNVTISDGEAPRLGNDQLSFQEGLLVQTQSGAVPLDLGSDAIATLIFQDNATMQQSLGELTSGNKATSYSFEHNGSVLVLRIDDASSPLNGQELLRVTINTDGSYTAVLSGPLDQISNNSTQLILPVLATDKDGDTSNLGAITLIINDANNAAPQTNPAATLTLVEGDLSPGTYPVSSSVNFTLPSTGDRLLPESITFDSTVAQLISQLNNLKVDGQALTFIQNGNVITGSVNGQPIVIIELSAQQSANHYDVNAQIKITLNGPIDHNQTNDFSMVHLQGDQIIIDIGVQIQDADGDYLSSSALVNASISDGVNPALSTTESINLVEPVGAAGVSAQAHFVIDLGSDPIKTLGFDYAAGEKSGIKSAGHDVLFEVVDGVLKGYYLDGGVRVDVLAATISYTNTAGTIQLQLFKPVDHSQSGQDVLSLDLKIRAVDTDGDATNLLLPVNITDSILSPSDLTASVVEGQTVSGTLADGYNLHAEGGHLNSISVPVLVNGAVVQTTFSFASQNSYVINTPKGELTINSDGSWQLKALANLDHNELQQLDISFTVIDGDGDISAPHDLVIGITDGAASSGGQSITTSLAEGDLSPNTYPTPILGQPLTINNNGSDQFDISTLAIQNPSALASELMQDLTFFNAATGQTEAVIATVTNNSIVITSASGQPVLEIKLIPTVLANGDIELRQDITLSQPLSHLIVNNTGSVTFINNQIQIQYTVQVADIDGDQLTNPVIIATQIIDGANPDLIDTLAGSITDGISQTTGVMGLNIGSDPIATINFNASQPAINGLTSNGYPTTTEISDHSIKVYDNNHVLVLQIDMSNSGHYTVALTGPLDQGATNLLSIPLGVTATDKDGDSDSATLTVQISDGANPVGGNVVNLTVTEGNLSGMGVYPVTTSQQFTILAGSDRLNPASINIDSAYVNALISELTAEVKSGGQTVTYTYDTTTHTLTGKLGADVVLTLGLTATQSGQNVNVVMTYTQYKPLDHTSSNSSGYVSVDGTNIIIKTPIQISDSDGDKLTTSVNATTTIVDGALPIINTIAAVTVKESDINTGTGSHQGSLPTAPGETASGSITVQQGSDKVVSYAIDVAAFNSSSNGLSSGGVPIVLSYNATTFKYEGKAGSSTKFTLTLDNKGTYTFVLLGSVDHPTGQDKNFLNLNFPVIAKDNDGDPSAVAFLPIRIEDDVPTAAKVELLPITEGGTVPSFDLINVAREGADTGKVISIVDGNTTYTVNATGTTSILIYSDPVAKTNLLGTLEVSADGMTRFISAPNIDHDSIMLTKELTFNVRDYDGDTANAVLIIRITDKAATLSIAAASGVEDVGRDANEQIITPAVGIPIAININIGDYDNAEAVGRVLIQVPALANGTFYYNGAALVVQNVSGVNYYVVPSTAFSTTDNVNYVLNGVSFVPNQDYSSTAAGLNFNVSVTIDTATGSKAAVTGILNINVQAIADAPTWNEAQTINNYTAVEDGANVSLKLGGQLHDLDGSETLDYYLVKITAGNGTLIGTGLSATADANGYYKISAANIASLQADPANDFSGIIKVEAIVVSKEASNYVSGQQYAQSAPKIITIDVAPDADPISLNITKPYIVSNEDALINLGTVINLGKLADNTDNSEATFVRISNIPDGAKIVLHGVTLDVSGLAAGDHNLSVTYTDGTGQHTANYVYHKDASSSLNDYFQVSTSDLNALQLKPVPESNVDFTLKVQGVVIDTAVLSTGTVSSTKVTEVQLVDVNLKGVADMPIFDVTGTNWTALPNGVQTTIGEDGQARLNFNVLSGEKALAPTDSSETLTMVISGIPQGAQLLDTNGNTLTLTFVGFDSNNQPKYEVNLSSISDLIIIPPVNSTADITLKAQLIVTENDGDAKVFNKDIVIHVTPVIDAGDYSKVSYGLEDGTVNINWLPPTFTDSQEFISNLKLDSIPDGARLLINGTYITNLGDTSVVLTAAQVEQLKNGAQLQLRAAEDSDTDINLTAIVTVKQTDADGTPTVAKDITGSLHLDIRAVVEADAALQVLNGSTVLSTSNDPNVSIEIVAQNGVTVDLSSGANSQGQIKFQDLDPSSVETIKTVIISGLGNQFVVIGGVYDGVGNWIVPEANLSAIQIISKFGYNGTINITIHAQVQDLGDSGEGDVSALAQRDTKLTLKFAGGGGGGPGDPITEAGVITINSAPIIGVEDVPVDISSQLANMLTLTGGTSDDVYALIINGSSVPAGYSLTGSGVIYDFVSDRYIITAQSNGAGGLILGSVVLETPKDFSGNLPFDINWAATNLASGDSNTGATPVQVPVDINPVVDLPPTISLQVVQSDGLDANQQPGGSETYPNIALEDGLITLNLGINSLDTDGSEQITSVKLKVDPAVGQLVDSNGNALPIVGGFVTVSVADLGSIHFKPVADYSGPVVITTQVTVVDSALNHANNTVTDTQTYTKDVGFNVIPVNDMVSFNGSNAFVGSEDTGGGIALSGMTVTTNDADGSERIVSLVIHGVPDGFLVGSAQNMGNGDWKVTVNSASYDLSNIKLIPPEDFSGTVNLTVTAYTKESLAALPKDAGTQALNITVNPVSDLVDIIGAGPATNISGIENSAPISIALNLQARDDTSSYTGNSPNVSENAPETLLLTIHGVPEGAEISLPAGVDGQIVSKLLDTTTNLWTWTISVNSSQLGSILFSPNDANGAIQLKIDAQAVDGNAIAGPAKEITVNLDIVAVNDAPENILPTTPVTTNEDTTVILEGIRISDIDAKESNGAMTVTLNVAHGTLAVGASADVVVTGNNSGSLTLVGTLDAINSLLAANVTYLGNPDFNGTDQLTMVTNDNGNSGGPALTATSTLDINVVAVNDAPVNTVPVVINAQEDQALTITQLQVHDVDAEQDNSTITVTLQVAHGNLTLVGDSSALTISGNSTNNLVLTGTVSQLNALLAAGVSYLADPDFHGTDALIMTTNDLGNSGIGGALTDIDTVPITVLPRADVPELTVINQSIVAALGALFPLHLAAEVVNPAANELSVRLDGLSSAPVDSDGNTIGSALGNNAWLVNADQLSNIYLQNLSEGEHTITVTAISSTATPQDVALSSAPQVINLTVLDATEHPLEGGAGSDFIIGSELNDILVGVLVNDILEGRGGDDLLYGGDGNDVLIGGPGNDLLTGGEGMDIFKWQAEDHGTVGAPDIDVITDFNPQEDKIDLSQLLQGENAGNYGNYLHFEYNDADQSTVLSISTQGQFSADDPAADITAKTDQVIMLQGVDLVGAPGSQVELINHLVALQQIIVDV